MGMQFSAVEISECNGRYVSMSAIEVAIVGMGPRGMTVLERLVSICRRFDCLSLVVHVVEPGAMGCGVHGLDQPSYLLLNTVCGLPTMFPPRQ